MTLVLDERATVPPGFEGGAASPGIDEADDVVMKYIQRWVDADGQISFPPSDPCSTGLLNAMCAARSDAVTAGLSG
jgi:hypothetical protein